MELGDVKNLDQLNSILNNTVKNGIGNAVKAKWATRDFVLTNDDHTTTTVKMKDLINAFQNLANDAKDADPEILKNIEKTQLTVSIL